MSIQVNTSNNMGSLTEREVKGTGEQRERQNGENNGSIYAGDLNLIGQDEIGGLNAKAQKEAMRTILSQYSLDKEIDNDLEKRRTHQKELQAQIGEANAEVARLEEKKGALKESFGIEDGSTEQKDLELLEKQKRIFKGSGEKLTEEETRRLINMGPMTEYQKAVMGEGGINEMIDHFSKLAEDAEREIIMENGYIKAIQTEVLKQHGMIDAVKQADEIREAAGKEIIGKLLEETKEHIEEEIEEEKEKAREIAEKEKDKQERVKEKEESQRDAKEVSEDLADIQNADADMEKVIQKIKKFIIKKNVLSADVPGIAVDEQV